jgi:uncharacterized protein (DUF488 family)
MISVSEKDQSHNSIWTIGHSTHTIEKFIGMLQSFEIKCLVDIRRYPGSKRYPHFNKEALQVFLSKENINYVHEVDLGGRRTPAKNSKNTGWRLAAFRGYADYMETDQFQQAVQRLDALALKQSTVYMCSEAVWWSCHRSLVSDYLKTKGWMVMHIMDINKAQEHPYTSPAKVVQGNLFYS